MSLEIKGKLLVKGDTIVVTDKFRKREFVLEIAEEINGNIYTNFAKMQLVQAKCDVLDRFQVGQPVRVYFNIKGNKWEKDGKVNYISNLDAWKVEADSQAQPQQQPQQHYGQPQQGYAGPVQSYGPSPAQNYSAPNTGYSQQGAPTWQGAPSGPVDHLPF